MKKALFFNFILLFISALLSPKSFARDTPQWGLPEGAKVRLGKGGISEITYSPDGTQLAVASSIGVWLYNAQTGVELVLFTGHTARVTSVAFSPDGSTLASGSRDGTILLWELTPATHTTDPLQFAGDINSYGVVNILDLVLVASHFGESGQNRADVNGDGVVNIQDLVLVAGAFGKAAAAPSAQPQNLKMLTAVDVKQWLDQAQQLKLTDVTSRRGILVLEQLLAALTPKETALLHNYPNPFNPETWIPYRLAHATDVQISIYDTRGTMVRRLNLGHQSAGFYTARAQAAYWDGRNERGELVASGLYFYQFRAGDYTALRRMVILK